MGQTPANAVLKKEIIGVGVDLSPIFKYPGADKFGGLKNIHFFVLQPGENL